MNCPLSEQAYNHVSRVIPTRLLPEGPALGARLVPTFEGGTELNARTSLAVL